MNNNKIIFEKSVVGHRGVIPPVLDVPAAKLKSPGRKAQPNLPQISEIELVRHYMELSTKSHGVDTGFYPLGSCTMKYNPRVNEDIASLKGFNQIHPLQSEQSTQGALEVLFNAQNYLAEISGMDAMTMQPAAGSHGELTGMLIISAYHQRNGDTKRTKIIIPDSAHGTNPASAAMAGFSVISIKSNEKGMVDLDALRAVVDDTTAGLMLTNPNTVGMFDENITEITKIIHEVGGLTYYDGANLNAIMGIVRPGDMGFDVMHLNLHKTFATPHGGGGPGSGVVGVKKHLTQFLPSRLVVCKNGIFSFADKSETSIGETKNFYGNFLVIVRAISYIETLGAAGLREASEMAVTNANYMMKRLSEYYTVAFEGPCMHEFVLSIAKQKEEHGVRAMDIAKCLIDYGIHPPTMYFPQVVAEALMCEPTETESKATLDEACDIFIKLFGQIETDKESILSAPNSTLISRPDEVKAAREPVLRYNFD